MSLRVAFEASSPDLALGPTLETMPTLAVELERQYAIDPDRPVSFCRVRTDSLERFEHALDRDETIASFDRIDRAAETGLYRLCRSDTDVVQAYREWVAAGGELLECHGSNGRWSVEMRFPDRASFGRYHDFLETEGVSLEVRRLAENDLSSTDEETELTESQREALRLAYEHGFFEVPRETGLAEIADRLDISTQAVSERLRRGQAKLVAEYTESN